MPFTRFWLMNDTEMSAFSDKLGHAVRRWQDEWLREDVAAAIALNSVDAPNPGYRWIRGAARQGLCAAVGVQAGTDWGLGFALTDLVNSDINKTAGGVARNVESEALRGLVLALLGAGGHVANKDPVTWTTHVEDSIAFDRRRGFVTADYQIRGSHAGVRVVLYPETTAAYLETMQAPAKPVGTVVAIRRALESQLVSADVVVGTAELLLQEVATLAVGNVLRLDRKLTEPMQVLLSGEDTLGLGHLGTAGDRKAVQITLTP